MYFLLSNRIDSMHLGQIKGRLKCLVLKKQFLANQNLAILPDTKHNTFWMKIYSGPWLFSLSPLFHIRFMLACKQKPQPPTGLRRFMRHPSSRFLCLPKELMTFGLLRMDSLGSEGMFLLRPRMQSSDFVCWYEQLLCISAAL